MDDSTECWLNIISKVSHYHLRKSPATFHRSRMLWDYEYLEYTASLVNEAGFILDKGVDPSKSESTSTIDIQDWHKLTNQQ
jgi:hypothetical protein